MGWMVGRFLFAALFLASGSMHFLATDAFARIVPAGLPAPRALVWISGAAELLLGALLLVESTRVPAAWGLIALLVAVFPANVFMYRHAAEFPVPAGVLLLRLPFQAVLIAWAWAYTRPRRARARAATAVLALGLATLPAGCGLGGPKLDRLPGGSMAVARNPTGRPITVYHSSSEETVADGTPVRVVSDAEGTVNQIDRKVIVGFSTGPQAGYAVLIKRSDLVPDR